MKQYQQLTQEQRYHMSGLLRSGFNQTQIAQSIGVNKSTISRELRRNEVEGGWHPERAHLFSKKRRQNCANNQRFSDADWDKVDTLLRADFSPEQVSGRLKKEGTLRISTEHIYRHVYANKQTGGDLHKHLRGQKPYRKRYGSGQERRGVIRNRVSIDERPALVDERSRMGDWEGDTVIGKQHQGALVTLVERQSQFVLVEALPNKQADGVMQAIVRLLKPHKDKCHTITFDNGKEFSEHEKIASSLNTQIYFAHPYHSWERGLNENTNGLLRQYFPKGKTLDQVTADEVDVAVNKLNHRPRKTLGYKTPHEVFYGVTTHFSRKINSVALRM